MGLDLVKCKIEYPLYL
uniref:Uncharacterized protein n=1 Tax=Rhizophora mucronata TaxID=61149 RepID=A0A2P2QC62_RHIMU